MKESATNNKTPGQLFHETDTKETFFFFFFYWVMLKKGHGDLYKAPTKEERRKRAAKRIER